jgi:hypothetical protein
MRTLLAILILAVSASFAQAQDPGQQAAQQAMQQAQLNAQLAQQNAQLAMQNAQQAAQLAQQGAQADPETIPCCVFAAKPKFSLKPGTYTFPETVKITDSARGAVIYYTTDGWTPTTASNRYLGPIAINSTTTLQAIAVIPYPGRYGSYPGRSFVVSAQYTINSPATAAPAALTSSAPPNPTAVSGATSGISADGKLTLPQGTPVPFVFAADVNSKTAAVGDQIPLTLDEDLMVGDVVVAPKGLPAVALVIQVDKTGIGGGPGDITFQVDSLSVNGINIRLHGFATKEGEAKPPNIGAMLIPFVGPFTVLKHGGDAEIKTGTAFTAFVDADTSLPPAK